jgi:hypothetical protein
VSASAYPILGTGLGALFIAGDTGLYGLYMGVNTYTGTSYMQAMRNNTATAYDLLLQPVGGNVGIGTTSPNAKLEVNGGFIRAQGTSTDQYFFEGVRTGNTTTLRIYDNGSNLYYDSYSNMMFRANQNGGSAGVIMLNGGNVGINTTSVDRKLKVVGSTYFDGYLNSDQVIEKYLGASSFTDGVANQAIDIRFGNSAMGGLIEIQITSTYSNQNAGGGITKIFALLTNPGNNIYTNESRVTEAIGNIVDNFSIGEFQWDSTNSTYRIPISHIVSTGNPVYVRIRALAPGTGPTIFDSTYLSSAYTLTALSKNYENFNSPVGIGNKSPGYALDVSGVIRSTTGAYLATSSGNVGIGTQSPASKLTIYEGDIRLYKTHVNGSTGTWLANINFTDEVDRLGARITGERTAWDGAPMGLGFDTGGVGSVSRRMTITSGGNVGIGTTSPSYLLDVAGQGRFTSALNANGQIIQGGGAARSTYGTTIAFTRNTAFSANSDPGDGERFLNIVNESSTTSAYSNICFRVNPSSAGGGTNAMLDMKFVNTNSGGASTLYWTFLHGGSFYDRLTLTSTGTLTAAGDVVAYSDARLKENVITIDNAVEKVSAMRGVFFNKKDDETKSRRSGVIAQEIQEILPEVVTASADGTLGVAYGNIVGVLIEAIKELKAEIDILKQK